MSPFRTHPFAVLGVALATIIGGLQESRTQTADSVLSSALGAPALQFQLVGGFGLNYWGPFASNSCLRVGADLAFGHSDNAGNSTETSISQSNSGASVSHYARLQTGQPQEKSTSYQVLVSGLYLKALVDYASAALYVGGGLSVDYNGYLNTGTSTLVSSDSASTASSGYDDRSTRTILGLGPTVLLGVRARLIGHVALTAEVNVACRYTWTWESSTYNSSSSNQPSYGYSSVDTYSSNRKGWQVTLDNIRIGVLIQL